MTEEPQEPQDKQPEDEAPETPEQPDAPAEEPTAPPPEEQPASEEPPAPEATPDEQPAAEEPPAAEKGKKTELPPGAELDPIAITDEKPMSAEERARLEAEEEERRRAEEAVTADPREEPAPAPVKPADLAKDARYSATGKRKTSVARVIIKPGGGSIEVNRRPLEEYFPRAQLQTIAKQALVQAGYEGTVDVQVRVHGGGIAGQASAVRHGIARALTEVDPNLRGELKSRGMLTRDARAKERRKAGLKKARKKPQFSKR
jgi:small subunit ribosomal protein S9